MVNRYDIHAIFIDIVLGKIASIDYINMAKLHHYA